MVTPFIEFYKDGKLEIEKKKKFLFKNFQTSKEYPLVKLFNKSLIEFDINQYKKDKKWIYKINICIEDCSANLIFIGEAKGFKIEEVESWTVALPKATVTGEIRYNAKKIKVEGTGYHDHNWNYSLVSALTYGKGWYWGKIGSESYNIVWANVVKRTDKWDLLAIVNTDSGFFNINQKNIYFKPDDYVRVHRHKTPTRFNLKINEMMDNVPIIADVKMEVIDLYYSSVFGLPYWRYHIKTSGFILVNSKKEKIDNTQIMEFLSFG